jgi:ribosomal protein S18 acetylase RimI-like enzyme
MVKEQIEVRVKKISPEYYGAARGLILKGMREHWRESFDADRNPDLVDFEGYYAEGTFLVALVGQRVVGTGALIPESENSFRVCRMSVDRIYRQMGIGRQILDQLCLEALSRGAETLVCETTAEWEIARKFYTRMGFLETHRREGDIHFRMDLRGAGELP